MKNCTIELENFAANVHCPNVATPDGPMEESKHFLFPDPSKNPTGDLLGTPQPEDSECFIGTFDVDVLSNAQIEIINSRKPSQHKESDEALKPQTGDLKPAGGLQNLLDSLKTFTVMVYEVMNNHMAKAVLAGGL